MNKIDVSIGKCYDKKKGKKIPATGERPLYSFNG